DSRNNPFALLIALDENGEADGQIYLDDGQSVDIGNAFSLIQYSVRGGVLNCNGTFGYPTSALLDRIQILGCPDSIHSIQLNNADLPATVEWNYNATTHTLLFTRLGIPMTTAFILSFAQPTTAEKKRNDLVMLGVVMSISIALFGPIYFCL